MYAGIVIEGPAAGRYVRASEAKQTLDGQKYSHRTLVRFQNSQTLDAWAPVGMTNAVALQRVFDGYAESRKELAK